MSEPAMSILGGHHLQRLGKGFFQGLPRPGAYASERRLDLGKGLFNRREDSSVGGETQELPIQGLHLRSPACSFCVVAFDGCQRFFLRVQPTRLIARLIVAVLTCTPCVCSHSRQWSSNLTSSWACSCATSSACNGANFLGGRPGIGLGASFPVSRRCFT